MEAVVKNRNPSLGCRAVDLSTLHTPAVGWAVLPSSGRGWPMASLLGPSAKTAALCHVCVFVKCWGFLDW